MEYTHINNREVYKKGRVDGKRLFMNGKTYRIISFELATGNFVVEEEKR